MKLLVREPETTALRAAVRETPLSTSAVARVEVTRAVGIANASHELAVRTRAFLASLSIVAVTEDVLETAASLVSADVRALDAIHLASALEIGADTMLVYDRRLAHAARAAGLAVLAPGT